MAFFVLFVCMLSFAIQHVLAVSPQQIETYLTTSLSASSEVVLTSNAAFIQNFTQRWTIYNLANPDYSIAAKPATIQDLQIIVKYAIDNEVAILATGGGHGYSTAISGVRQALDVDLGNFKHVSVDTAANTMSVGGSTIFADIYDPLYTAGKQFRKFGKQWILLLRLTQGTATGGSSSPGILGVTLGGGIGPLTGAHGLLIDSLLSVDMVTGKGDILSVSASQNAELFWGLRGAGVNFGVVTSATFRVYDTLNNGNVYNADLIFSAEKNASVFQILSSYQGNQDDNLAISIASSLRNNTASLLSCHIMKSSNGSYYSLQSVSAQYITVPEARAMLLSRLSLI